MCGLAGGTGASPTPRALAEWRSLADQDFAAFCTIELFLAKTDAELAAAVMEYPKQILGFLARIARIESCLAVQQQAMTELMARIEVAMMQTDADPRLDLAHGGAGWGRAP